MRAGKKLVWRVLQLAGAYCLFGICGIVWLLWRWAGPLVRDEGGPPP